MDERLAAARIDRWTKDHQHELLRDLRSLIRIPSVVSYGQDGYPMGEGCKRALDMFELLSHRYGLKSINHDDYALSILLPGSEGGIELGMLGHLDTVAAGEGWKTNPLDLVEEHGYLFGRGVLDNKGPIVMCLYVLRCIHELGLPIHSTIRLIAGCDEEANMLDVQHFLSHNQSPDFTLNCDGAWPLCLGEKGIINARLIFDLPSGCTLTISGGSVSNVIPESCELICTTDAVPANLPSDIHAEKLGTQTRFASVGRSSHCAWPSKGDNAILKLLRYLTNVSILDSRIQDCFRNIVDCFTDDEGTGLRICFEDALSGKTTCVPTRIETAYDKMIVYCNIRYAVTQPYQILLQRLVRRCMAMGCELEVLSHSPARNDSLSQPVLKLLLETSQKFVGKQCKPYYTGGGTHSRLFPYSVPFGPEKPAVGKKRGGSAHEANESIRVADLLEGIKIYIIALSRLDNYLRRKKSADQIHLLCNNAALL